jgi:hypothetical protein
MQNTLCTANRVDAMTHAQFIDRFERDLVPEESFHHADHVRLAFAYLTQFPALEALDRFSSALRRYAAARGKPGRYHETITYAFFFLIRERMAGCSGSGWDDFASANPDLLAWKNGVLDRYYDKTALDSDLARQVFVLPRR